MQKITFVVGRYGLEINGGGEVHCRMLAERLAQDYEVEVLTTCINNYQTFEVFYNEGTEIINNVLVRRFKTEPFNPVMRSTAESKAKYARKIRRMVYRLKLSKLFSLHPIWHFQEQKELAHLKTDGLYSPNLAEYLNTHYEDSKAIIIFSYYYPFPHFLNDAVYQKSILIPTAHYDGIIFRSTNSQLFNKVAYIGFNSEAEQNMCRKIFRQSIAKHGIISVGVDILPGIPFEELKNKYHLPEKYLLYFGRVDKGKIGKLISYFLAYKNTYNDDLYLVLTGGSYMEAIVHPYIIYTGFVSEAEKTALIENANIVVNPSERESLSLLLLEAMQLGKTVLVTGKSEVLKNHCYNSNFACDFYTNKTTFIKKLHTLYSHPEKLKENVDKAKAYVEKNYDWDVIMNRLKKVISEI